MPYISTIIYNIRLLIYHCHYHLDSLSYLFPEKIIKHFRYIITYSSMYRIVITICVIMSYTDVQVLQCLSISDFSYAQYT